INDTYLANHVRSLTDSMSAAQHDAVLAERSAAAAAVGTVSTFLWFIGLIVGAIAAGSTSIIARATGARHRSLANAVCGQSIFLGILMGFALCLALYMLAAPLPAMTGLRGQAQDFALTYLKMLAFAVPFSTVM